jgi:hypothetical protein
LREAKVAAEVRLALQVEGTTLFRNSVGTFQVIDEKTGALRYVQAGLGKGSADFIGFTEITIREEHVGRKIAVFTAIETKRSTGGRKSAEQINFINRICSVGGIAGFAESVESAVSIVKNWGK